MPTLPAASLNTASSNSASRSITSVTIDRAALDTHSVKGAGHSPFHARTLIPLVPP
jgi:hypothetical protein